MQTYKVVYGIGKTKLSVIRKARTELEALDNARKERKEIQYKEQGMTVLLLSLTQIR